PLIFYHEIEHLLGTAVEPPDLPTGTPMATLDRVVATGMSRYPHEYIQFVSWNPDERNLVYLSMAKAPDAPPDDNRFLVVDGRTAELLGEPSFQEGLMPFLLSLHVDMFAGLPGKLFLGLMGLLFVVAIISGVVVYGPYMRKLDFGTVRKERAARLK